MSDAKDKLLLKYAKLAKKLKSIPTRAELAKDGMTRDMVRHHFSTMENLRESAQKAYPNMFSEIISPEIFNNKALSDIKEKAKKHKRFVITTAVAGAPIHDQFFDSIKNYCNKKQAMLLVIPANYALYDIDPDLIHEDLANIVFKPIKLNSNIYIDPIKIDPKQVDPVVGLDALGRTDGTVIIGSPKQRRLPIANSNTKLARIIHSTGAITRPRYIPSDRVPKRRDRLAEAHHVMGALIVEIVDDNFFHMRNIQMSKDGSFVDVFARYHPDGTVEKERAEAIIQGDYHVTETDSLIDDAVDRMCKLGNPKYRVLHDFFSGVSINHHEMQNKVARAVLAKEKKISLEDELKENGKVIEKKRNLNTAEKIVIVKSNHDEFLDRYLAKGDFDDLNRVISTKLQIIAMEGKDPLRYGLEMLGFDVSTNLIWLERDVDFRIAGVECGAHGDLGANGKRNPGSKGMYKAYGKVIYGHCHFGEMWHGAWSVGTSTYRKLPYNKGASSWDNSQAVVYKDGTRQLLNVIVIGKEGKWCLDEAG